MFRIEDDNELYLTRGDTAYLYVEFDGYEPGSEDTLTLTVRKQIDDTTPLLAITVNAQDECLVIQPQDTKEWNYGKYLYDIQLDTEVGEVFTIIEKSKLHITEEVSQ